jgi:hypothetical protein
MNEPEQGSYCAANSSSCYCCCFLGVLMTGKQKCTTTGSVGLYIFQFCGNADAADWRMHSSSDHREQSRGDLKTGLVAYAIGYRSLMLLQLPNTVLETARAETRHTNIGQWTLNHQPQPGRTLRYEVTRSTTSFT